MRGYVLERQNVCAWHDDLPIPVIGPYGALIKPVIVATCTSDVHLKQSGQMPHIYGKALGHEMAGRVYMIGSEVKDFKVGDRVVIMSNQPDWRSMEAQDGWPQTKSLSHYRSVIPNRGGTFAEYYAIEDADTTLARIPESVTWEQAVVISDMPTTAFSGIEKMDIRFGDTVVILGIGPVGITAVAGAVLKGAGRIIGVGSRKVCADIARQYGASDIVNYKNGDIVEQIFKLTGGKPVDSVLVTGGNADSLVNALRLVKKGGIVSNVNMYTDASVTIPLDVWGACIDNKQIKACSAKGGRLYTEKLMRLVEYGRYKPELIITHVFHGMEHVVDALDLMEKRDPNVIKPVVYFD